MDGYIRYTIVGEGLERKYSTLSANNSGCCIKTHSWFFLMSCHPLTGVETLINGKKQKIKLSIGLLLYFAWHVQNIKNPINK